MTSDKTAMRQEQTRAALFAAGRLCWPPPAQVEPSGRGQGVAAGRSKIGEFLVIPSVQHPRLLVPAGAPAAAAESVRRFSQALSLSERVLRIGVAGALRSGLLDRITADRIRITVEEDRPEQAASLQTWASEILNRPVVLSLGVGTPRANRKPVLQAISRAGEALAFIKIGDNGLTRQLLRDEARALERLAGQSPQGLVVPRLIHLGDWNGLTIMVQSALATPAVLTHRRRTIPHQAMRSLTEAFDLGRLPLNQSPSWQLISTSLPVPGDEVRNKLFTRVAQAIGTTLGDIRLRHGSWHGDWTAWNMAWTGKTIRIWDWERFAEGVPVGFDPLHYALNGHIFWMTWKQALDALRAQAPAVLRPSGIAPSETVPLLNWYLLELARRYLQSAASAAGEPLRAKADDLLHHLAAATLPGEAQETLPDWRTT